ncbi:tRNA pseudouridine(38-40) synthase [Pneumocystis carinii B80]|uniref:tRNA pseudouridine(38-40) synthase n=1 Tax=Pneumocystis carinii (strain B80) TaxID=1408658 RepID=A0A0W4ZBP2_PNEC8|nr:tRNA pseudouridine(38-40) synthase [Pneumocystis carinii B80]KTW25678.1 tRNA pseudouridine(38-40) synthase [Pneumocystis carinii B80]
MIGKLQFRNFASMESKIYDYSSWTKDDLIKKIISLEHEILLKDKKNINTKQFVSKKSHLCNESFKPSKKPFCMSDYNQKYIAFKFAYLGWYYNGLVTQGNETRLPTVEETIFFALKKAKLIDQESNCNFSRCGRTDKSVSAIGQVIALNVRSNKTFKQDSEENCGEIKYIDILNKLLPKTIRILAWCSDLPSDFSARFSCQKRHYKYLFFKNSPGIDLNIEKMSKAASYFVGEHDFRNFCKLDSSKSIKNFTRTIIKSEISKYNEEEDDSLYIFDLEGTAFLWHQVRCMISILFLVGQNLEEPEIVKTLLDISKTPNKPVYNIADGLPLILYDCHFENLNWNYGPNRNFVQNLYRSIYDLWHTTKIQNSIIQLLLKNIPNNEVLDNNNTKKILIKNGTGINQSLTKYIQMENRK